MALTQAQLAVVKAYIVANPTLNAQPTDGDGLNFIADALNAVAVPDYMVYNVSTDVPSIYGAIDWQNFTPSDKPPAAAVPATPTEGEKYALSLWHARAHLCQGKQINAQMLLQGRDFFSSAINKARLGLKDLLQKIPAGAGGVDIDAGWNAVKATMTHKASVLEKLLAIGGVGTVASPDDPGYEGAISANEVDTARRLP